MSQITIPLKWMSWICSVILTPLALAKPVVLPPNGEVTAPLANKLSISGPIQVEVKIIGNKTRILDRSGGNIAALQLDWQEGHLSIQANPSVQQQSGVPRLVVYLPALYELTVTQGAYVQGDQIRAQQLTIHAAASKIRFAGEMEVREVAAENAEVRLYWVMGESMQVKAAGNSQVLLSGKVTTLHAHASDTSYLAAHYLNVHRAFVSSYDQSLITVSPREVLNAKAYDYSNIHYFHSPTVLSTNRQGQGSVLDWTGMEMSAIQ